MFAQRFLLASSSQAQSLRGEGAAGFERDTPHSCAEPGPRTKRQLTSTRIKSVYPLGSLPGSQRSLVRNLGPRRTPLASRLSHHCTERRAAAQSRLRSPRLRSSISDTPASEDAFQILRESEVLTQADPPSYFDGLASTEGTVQLPWLEEPELLLGCEADKPGLNVAVLLSGGVDSSVAMRLLQGAGHHCTAFYLQIYVHEDYRNFWAECPWEEDLEFAKAVSEQAGVELKVVPLTKQYWDRVVSHTIGEVRSGRTPNPDILCNSRIKFGAFFDFLEEHHAGEFDRVASGHYARIERPESAASPARLGLCADSRKDQTYFLAKLEQRQLQMALFPLGQLPKPRVRELAAALLLPNRLRKDSQGICFLGKVRFSEFIEAQLGTEEGDIVEHETGVVLGKHRGFWFHTIGQRQGLRLSHGPWYVAAKDVQRNIVYASKDYYNMPTLRNRFQCGEFSWTAAVTGSLASNGGYDCSHVETGWRCKVRHGAHMYTCSIQFEPGGESAEVVIDGDDQGLAAGQYAVFYNEEGYCMGCAIIQSALPGAIKEPHVTDSPPGSS
ncbi:hypothetical protein CYMTET_21583 [Cymbomonas tetramitiformis]|uniref:tRNA-5-taurinomethyluridine 2-sulfurtransferase n=1 Tax=Cymbomonas tetramitiformis TaxID=36881 RepID=A0AAE0G1U9_9CHLO|nr:hypothetical protein CYMTET_21583 [Cymbomonas tetramitiformis]